jgi:small GTP-binding protein
MIRRKVCMVGVPGVGKTSLVRRFVHSAFSDRYHSTLGVKVDTKSVEVGGTPVTLVLWDISGLDRLDTLSTTYLRGASGYLLVADGTEPASFETALRLKAEIDETLGDLPFVVLLNKADLEEAWALADAEQELRARGWPLAVTSAKTGAGVEEGFSLLAGAMHPSE